MKQDRAKKDRRGLVLERKSYELERKKGKGPGELGLKKRRRPGEPERKKGNNLEGIGNCAVSNNRLMWQIVFGVVYSLEPLCIPWIFCISSDLSYKCQLNIYLFL